MNVKIILKTCISVLKKNLIVFHNGSNYDYCCIIKELAEQFKKQFTCLEKNIEI